MFEHRREPLVTRAVFLSRVATSLGIAAIILACSLLAGMLGYHVLEGLSWLDSFLNASMLLSGMGPVATIKTSAGKVFAGIYALFSGVAFLTSIAVVLAPIFHRFLHKFHLEK